MMWYLWYEFSSQWWLCVKFTQQLFLCSSTFLRDCWFLIAPIGQSTCGQAVAEVLNYYFMQKLPPLYVIYLPQMQTLHCIIHALRRRRNNAAFNTYVRRSSFKQATRSGFIDHVETVHAPYC